jgi:predicted metal-binding membrane protein
MTETAAQSLVEGGQLVNVESRRAVAPPIVAAATLGLAGACWAVTAWLMGGMDMGIATTPGPFGYFTAVWLTMMAAMMLPGAAPAVASRTRTSGVRAAPSFAGSYLAIWGLAGVVAYALDRPHGSPAAGVVVIAAGIYELTPVKRHFRRRCHEGASSGMGFGLCCAGSCLGLMAMLVALDVMSLLWMSVVAALVSAQKLLPVKAAIDIPLALTIAGLGFVIIFAPALVPGLSPPPPM